MDKQNALLEAFSTDTNKLQHLLLYGPPGSGKTTFARSLVESIWGKQFLFSGALFLNASDERSLDSIRAKVYPFFNNRFTIFDNVKKPRFLVLDESETLTDQAQLAIRPILDYSPQSMCVIFLCNSLSRVHISLRSRFLRIRFEPLSQDILLKRLNDYSNEKIIEEPAEFDRIVHRSDLRYFLQKPEKLYEEAEFAKQSQPSSSGIRPNSAFCEDTLFAKQTPSTSRMQAFCEDAEFVKQTQPSSGIQYSGIRPNSAFCEDAQLLFNILHKKPIENRNIRQIDLINIVIKLYEKGYSGLDLMKYIEQLKTLDEIKKYQMLLVFNKVKKEFRNEKLFILFILNFMLLRSEYDLENISFM
jgi:DNA polymerase III delta prime subunit